MIEQIYIGIDTGVHTGVAIWSKSGKRFVYLKELKIHNAMLIVLAYFHNVNKYQIVRVRVEDARKRSRSKSDPKYYATMQGAASVKRDASVWEDFLKEYNIPFEMVAPQSNITKVDENKFTQMTGVAEKSNHVRDAAMLVFNF